jgi:hypothetical protein
MNPINRFSLEKHEGPYEKWPLRTQLYMDNKPTRTYVSGFVLLHQFETVDSYLLILDDDCPFEERATVVLLNQKLRVRSQRSFWFPYESYLLENVTCLDKNRIILTFYENIHKLITIRRFGIPFIFPQLKVQSYVKSD